MSHPIPHLYHFHSNSNRRTSPRRPIGSKTRQQGDPLPCIEPLEGRVLLSSYALSTLGVFAAATMGSQPNNVIVDASGDLYGTTTFGGAGGFGTVFEIAHGSGTITTLASFDGANGMDPNTIVRDASGNLYGTAYGGGANGDGTVFELAAGSRNITTLALAINLVGPHALILDDN